MRFTRRDFLRSSLAATAGGLVLPALVTADEPKPLFKISLAQWSLNKALFGNKLNAMDFAVIAKKDFGIDAIEYVNQFYKGKGEDMATLAELKKKADDNGVTSLLIMCDGEGQLGDANEANRKKA